MHLLTYVFASTNSAHLRQVGFSNTCCCCRRLCSRRSRSRISQRHFSKLTERDRPTGPVERRTNERTAEEGGTPSIDDPTHCRRSADRVTVREESEAAGSSRAEMSINYLSLNLRHHVSCPPPPPPLSLCLNGAGTQSSGFCSISLIGLFEEQLAFIHT